MLIKEFKRIFAYVGLLIFLLFVINTFYDERLVALLLHGGHGKGHAFSTHADGPHLRSWQETFSTTTSNDRFGATEKDITQTHHEIFSVSTADKKYFLVDFGEQGAINPNIIPHPVLNDTWIIVAQRQKSSVEKSVWFAELVCNAVFSDGVLGCLEPPVILPIAATFGDKCVDDLAYFSLSIGPHDARVFYGPRMPYAIYGSNSAFTCFGQCECSFLKPHITSAGVYLRSTKYYELHTAGVLEVRAKASTLSPVSFSGHSDNS